MWKLGCWGESISLSGRDGGLNLNISQTTKDRGLVPAALVGENGEFESLPGGHQPMSWENQSKED